jgi:hypothetical protein
MTEQQGIYKDDEGNALSPGNDSTAEATKLVIEAIGSFHWRADYIKFCELLGFEPSDYAEGKWKEFHDLVSNLNSFDVEALTKIVKAGSNP